MQPIILAAGKGTRMRSEKPKVLHEVAGKAMLHHVLDTLSEVQGCAKPVVVVGYCGEEVAAAAGVRGICVEQKEISGTASAVAEALKALPQSDEAILVLYGDHPFITAESIECLEEEFREKKAALAFATTTVPDFDGSHQLFLRYGRVIRDGAGHISKIIEYKDASEEERAVRELNPGPLLFDRAWLERMLPRVQPSSISGEYYLTELIEMAMNEGQMPATVSIAPAEAAGINSPEEAAHAATLRSGETVL